MTVILCVICFILTGTSAHLHLMAMQRPDWIQTFNSFDFSLQCCDSEKHQ